MRTLGVVVSTPSLAFSARIGKIHEPVRIQAFCTELAVQALDERVIRRLAAALDLYADEAPPPGLHAMAGRARRYERRIRAGVLSAAAVIVFAAGWIGDEWLMRPAASAPGDVVELVEADRDWDAQVEFASFDDMTLNGVSPAPLTELGHYLSRTETLRAESAVLQRMRYRSNDGRRVSIVLKRDVRSETDEIRFTRLKGRDVAHWSDDVFSVGVIGELPRDELQQVAEQVRSHLADTGSRPAQPRRLVDEAPHGAVSAPGEMITVAGDGPGR